MNTGLIEMPKSATEPPESQVTPEPALEKRTRRQFTPDYKLRMITEADACKYGELGAMLRRENPDRDWMLMIFPHDFGHGVKLPPQITSVSNAQ